MSLQKQVEITDDIIAQIERVTKTSVSADDIVVFEAAAASTRAITKHGSIFHGSIMSRSMLHEMAERLNDGSESVPLHTLHMQGGEIPVGRVFQGRVVDEIDGSSTLRAMFYLPLAERELIEKINLGILDEVSIGAKSDHAYCSKCGFDFFGEEADFTHLFSQTCSEGHTIGENGTHLKLEGLDKWMELSLVSRGASDKPKILSRPKKILSQEEHDRIAADGKPVEALFLFTSMATETPDMPKENLQATEAEEEVTSAEEEEEDKKIDTEGAGEGGEEAADEGGEEAADEGGEDEGEGEGEGEAAEFDIRSAVENLGQALAELAAHLNDEPEEEPEEEPTIESLQAQLAAATARIDALEASETEETEEEEEAGQPEITLKAGGHASSAVSDAKSFKGAVTRASAFKTKR